MIGFTRPKRFCVPENKHYTAVETKALDALEAACERANIETARMKALLREVVTGQFNLIGTNLLWRIRAALGDEPADDATSKQP